MEIESCKKLETLIIEVKGAYCQGVNKCKIFQITNENLLAGIKGWVFMQNKYIYI